MKKYFLCFMLIISLLVFGAGCGKSGGRNGNNGDIQGDTGSDKILIQLNGTSISAPDKVALEGSDAVITNGGTYEITGTLDNGQIRVNTTGAVTLILNNADIHCETSAPIFIQSAEYVYLQLSDGSVNTVSDGSSYQLPTGADEPDAAIFTKADMTVSGGGSLTVNASCNDAIAGRDSLIIESGNINITSINHGIKGKDYLAVKGGSVTVNAVNDAIKSTNDKDAALGYVDISGGTLTLTADDEAISAVTKVSISGGNINIDTHNNAVKSDGDIEITGGKIEINTEDKDFVYIGNFTLSDSADVTSNGSKITQAEINDGM